MAQNQSNIRLPRLISDGMVIQRNEQVTIWGWAPAGEVITIYFIEKVYHTTVDSDGKWQINLKTGNAGGPYDMEIGTKECAEKVVIKNILLGDIWLCSGQSNMEMKMLSVKDIYPEEIANANNDSIRQFLVPVKYDFEMPQTDFETGNWETVNPHSILNFSAVGYFFAAKLYEKYQIPIGLINASLGGSPAEAWMSEDALLQFPNYLQTAIQFKDKNYINRVLQENQTTMDEWYRKINENDIGMPKMGMSFFDPEYNASDWQYIKVPSYWEDEGLGHFNGVVWFRKEIELPSNHLVNPATLYLGNIVDEDTVYINGTKIGTTPMQYIPRKYDIPQGLLKAGKNTIVVRLVNLSGKGGFYKGKPYQLRIGDQIIDLCGEWQYMIGGKSEPMPNPTFVMWQPSGLYNGMIAPMIRYVLKGVIWYQGETNAQKPEDYESLLKSLISDWRKKWNNGELPFLYVQLPNFLEPEYSPAAGKWPKIREAQRKTLEVPDTGMAVTIDIGEWNDVHPLNKRGVGERLALVARKAAYGDIAVVASGPMYQSAKRDRNRIVLSFSDTGSGLVTKGGDRPGHFTIAGADNVFVRAEAKIEEDRVIVWHEQVPYPIHVRYAWEDNPEGANLYNREGLPASPFTTEL